MTDLHLERLYPYQRDAVERMLDRNVLLAYDMGTGKTLTTLTAIEMLAAEGEITKPGIVLAPRSLLYQWMREIHKWFPQSEVFVLDGTPEQRKATYDALEISDTPEVIPGASYMLMTYETWVRDHERLIKRGRPFDGFMVLDEATAIKSFKSKRSQLLKKYRRHYNFRFALTGTPLENGKLEELYSILQWVDKTVLPKWHHFEEQHLLRHPKGWVTGYKNIDAFRKRIAPVVLRKTVDDPDVAPFMPKVIQLPEIEVLLDSQSRRVHNYIAQEIVEEIDRLNDPGWSRYSVYDEDAPPGDLMGRIVTLRMLLDHPVAVLNSAARYDDPDDDRGSKFAMRITLDGTMDRCTRSPKLEAVERYIADFFDAQPEKSKVVIFCSFLDVAEQIHRSLPWGSTMLTGEMSAKERDESKNRFLSDPDVRVFVSTDAGGHGLDLPVANLLINYDLPWQPGVLDQRNARIRRASSEWGHVYVVNAVTMRTFEERMVRTLGYKSDIAASALGDLLSGPESGKLPESPGSLKAFMEEVLGRSLIRAS